MIIHSSKSQKNSKKTKKSASCKHESLTLLSSPSSSPAPPASPPAAPTFSFPLLLDAALLPFNAVLLLLGVVVGAVGLGRAFPNSVGCVVRLRLVPTVVVVGVIVAVVLGVMVLVVDVVVGVMVVVVVVAVVVAVESDIW
jgi:hypothetical protein